jgi:hypothetical protein
VTKIGSDVNLLLLLGVVPRLRPGVHIHLHDIIWPFEYARKWVYQGRAWNQAYLLRGPAGRQPAAAHRALELPARGLPPGAGGAAPPLWLHDSGTSMWLETA